MRWLFSGPSVYPGLWAPGSGTVWRLGYLREVKDAGEGEAAVDQAIDILSHFYGAAAKATVRRQQARVQEKRLVR